MTMQLQIILDIVRQWEMSLHEFGSSERLMVGGIGLAPIKWAK